MNIVDRIPDEVGNDVMEIKGQDDIVDTRECPERNRKDVVFDDLANAPEKNTIQGYQSFHRWKASSDFTDLSQSSLG